MPLVTWSALPSTACKLGRSPWFSILSGVPHSSCLGTLLRGSVSGGSIVAIVFLISITRFLLDGLAPTHSASS